MINAVDRNIVHNIVTTSLGNYYTSKGELIFYCPFCNHHKQKLQINLDTQKWHCWVCNSGGSKLSYLLNQLDVDANAVATIRTIYKDHNTKSKKSEDSDAKVFISLPSEARSLTEQPKGFNPELLHAVRYLQQRGITTKHIVKYNIHYSTEGKFARRIIIPSYNDDGSLNYFISRSYYPDEKLKYKNPPISKNVICFENQINWKEPIILCEGVFDAITIRRNVIPLLGKFPSKKLKEKIFKEKVSQITISLDNDAKKEAYKMADYFIKQNINVKLMDIEDKDASEIGYSKFYEKLNQTTEFTEEDVLLNKIAQI